MDKMYRFCSRYAETLAALRSKFDCNKVIVSYYSTGDVLEKEIELDADNVGTIVLRNNMPEAEIERINIKYVSDEGDIVYKQINYYHNQKNEDKTIQIPQSFSNHSQNMTSLNGLNAPILELYEVKKAMELQGVHIEYNQKEFNRLLTEKEKEITRLETENGNLSTRCKKLKKKLKEKESVEWYADIATKGAPLGKIIGAILPESRLANALSGIDEKPKEKEKVSENEQILAIHEALKGLEDAKRLKDIEALYNLICQYFEQQQQTTTTS